MLHIALFILILEQLLQGLGDIVEGRTPLALLLLVLWQILLEMLRAFVGTDGHVMDV